MKIEKTMGYLLLMVMTMSILMIGFINIAYAKIPEIELMPPESIIKTSDYDVVVIRMRACIPEYGSVKIEITTSKKEGVVGGNECHAVIWADSGDGEMIDEIDGCLAVDWENDETIEDYRLKVYGYAINYDWLRDAENGITYYEICIW